MTRTHLRWGRRESLAMLSLLCAAILNGCASTALKTTWKDPAYSFGSIKSILVLGVTNQESSRRFFEDEFGRTFRTYGIHTTPSYRLTPGGTPDEAVIKKYVKDQGIQAVLVTRLLNKKTVDRVVPPSTTTSVTTVPVPAVGGYYMPNGNTSGYYGYYHYSQQFVTTTTPGYTVQEEIVDAETRLFDVSSEHLIWTGTSETLLGGSVEGLIREYVQIVTRQIFKPGR